MKIQKLYSTIKPYAAMSVLILSISSLSVNAMGDKHEYHNSSAKHENAEGRDHQPAKMKKHLHRLAKKLDLTSEQRSKIKVIYANMRDDRQEDKANFAGFKQQVQALLQASEFDEIQFTNIYAKYQPSFQKLAMEKAKVRHAVMQILSPVQQEKFLTMRKHR